MASTTVVVETGPRTGHKFWLRTHQSATVGRSEYADFSVRDDRHLAPIHFSVESDMESCELVDLTGLGSTTVNGAPVSRQLIFHGDRIEAGNTRMRVQVQSDRKSIRHSQSSFGGEETGYEMATSPNGISYYVAQSSAPPAAEVAQMLGGAFHRLLLVNPNKYSGPLPEQDNPAWQWNIQGRPGQRLLVYSLDDPIDVTRIMKEVWDHDAACLLLSRNRKGGTMKQLKSVASAYLRPSLLKSQLHSSALPVVSELMADICGVLTPTHDATGWHLYAHPELAPNWEYLGLPGPPADVAACA